MLNWIAGPNNAAAISLNDGDADDSLPVAAADVALGWQQAHRFAVLKDSGLGDSGLGGLNYAPERWDSGAVNAVVADGRTAIAGTRSGGVWLINPEFSAAPQTQNFPAESLSYGWESRAIAALEWGPERPRFVFAATSRELFLLEFQTRLGGLDYVGATALVRHSGMGAIRGLTYLDQHRVLVAATNQGVWWTKVPLDARQVTPYRWERCVDGLDDPEFSCIAPIRDDATVAVAGVSFNSLRTPPLLVHSAIYCGTWTGAGFSFVTSVLPQGVEVPDCRISSCAVDRTHAYAVSIDSSNVGIGALLQSTNGGANWSAAVIPPGAGEQGSYNMCIAAHPTSRDTVVVGWQKGAFVSIDAGHNWQLRPPPHEDLHALVFVQQGSGVEYGLFVASDGGLAFSGDLGATWDTRYNKHLLGLEIYSPHDGGPNRHDTSPFDVSEAVAGLIACATQDNGNLWCALDDLTSETVPPWEAFQEMDGGDGATTLLLADQSALCSKARMRPVDADTVRSRAFKGTFPRFFEAASSPVPVAGLGQPIGNPTALARPRVPGLERDGAAFLAVAGKMLTLYVLWREPGKLGEFEAVAQLDDGEVTCVATYDGSEILAGTKAGKIFLCNHATGSIVEHPVDQANAGTAIMQVLWALPDARFALTLSGRILKWDGKAWQLLANGPQRAASSIEFAPQFAGGVLFAATDYGVLLSQDRGATWSRTSDGLPRNSAGSGLKIGSSGGRHYLYLSTYGWGVFRADITARNSVRIRIPRHDLIRRLFPIIEERAGIEIRDGDIFRVDHSPDAYRLAVVTLISNLAQDAFPVRDGAEGQLRSAAYGLEQKLARQAR